MDEPGFRPVSRRIFTVNELTRLIREALEKSFTYVWVSGEISNFRSPSSGHFYFTLKDDKAQIRAIMFRGLNRHLKFDLEDGMHVICLGRLSVYEPQGVYQLILEHVEPEGLGALALAFEQMKQKLAAEGLFDASHKKELPFLPKKVAVITSPTGAVVHDIIRVARRRFDTARIMVVPVKVQGEQAPAEMVNALKLVNDRTDADVIIVGRGGGSMEDLAAFNSEDLARAVFASRVPVVSAVGHETDFSICDFVADLRAPTPSAAAELVFPEKERLYLRIDELFLRLNRSMDGELSILRRRIVELSSRLGGPGQLMREMRSRAADLDRRLYLAVERRLSAAGHALASAQVRLAAAGPRAQVADRAARVSALRDKMAALLRMRLLEAKGKSSSLAFRLSSVHAPLLREAGILLQSRKARMLRAMETRMAAEEARTSGARARLVSLDPDAVLRRGYSITRLVNRKKPLLNAEKAPAGSRVSVRLASGELLCRVTESNTMEQEEGHEKDEL